MKKTFGEANDGKGKTSGELLADIDEFRDDLFRELCKTFPATLMFDWWFFHKSGGMKVQFELYHEDENGSLFISVCGENEARAIFEKSIGIWDDTVDGVLSKVSWVLGNEMRREMTKEIDEAKSLVKAMEKELDTTVDSIEKIVRTMKWN